MRAVACLGAVIVTLAGVAALNRASGSLRYLSYDIPFLVHRAESPDDIRIVYLDELDGDVLDRSVQAGLLDRLHAAGARAVIYDVIFDQPSADPAVDRAFAAAMRRFRGVDENGEPVPGARQRHLLLACGSKEVRQSGMEGHQLIAPQDDLLDAADDIGLVLLLRDENFTVRELVAGTKDEASLAWKAAVLLGAPLKEEQRLDSRWLNYAGPSPRPNDFTKPAPILSCGARDVLNGFDPDLFRDKIIVIGGKPGIVAAELGSDLFATPFNRFDRQGALVPLMSGVELQANALSNYLRGNWLVRTSDRTEFWLIIALGILAGAGFTAFRPMKGFAIALGVIALLIVVGIASVHWHRLWFPWSIAAFLQVPLAFVWGTGARFYVERFFRLKLTDEQQKLHDAFKKYLSPQMLQKLIDDGFQMEPGGYKVHAAMMFTDLESFTDMCERVGDPARILEVLNNYFERTTRHIFDHDGVVIKYMGDAIYAAWGAPAPTENPAALAIRAAWGLHQSTRLVIDGIELKTRIGINSGEVLAGHIGSRDRVDYSLIGDPTNLAARLEGMNKMLGTHVLVSDAARVAVGDEFLFRKVGAFKVKGRKAATVVHELLGPGEDADVPEWIALYHRGVDALAANDPATAAGHFHAVIALRGTDGPSSFFLTAIARGDLSEDGVCELKEK